MHVDTSGTTKEAIWFNTERYIMRVEVDDTMFAGGTPNFKLWRYIDTRCSDDIGTQLYSGNRCSSIQSSWFLSMQFLEEPANDLTGNLYVLSLMGLEDETGGGLNPIYRVRIDLLDGGDLTSTNIGVFNEFSLQSSTPHAEWNYVETGSDTHYLYAIFDEQNQQMTVNFAVDIAGTTLPAPVYHTTVLDGIEYPRELAMQEDMAATYGDGGDYKWMILMEAKDKKKFYLMEFTYTVITVIGSTHLTLT